MFAVCHSQGFSVGSNIWVTRWTDDPIMYDPKNPDFESTRNTYLGVYGAFGAAQGDGCLCFIQQISETFLKRL